MARKEEDSLFDESLDPLAGLDEEAEEPKKSRLPKLKKEKKDRQKKAKKKSDSNIVRVEDLDSTDIDTDDVVSMYLPRRRARLLAAAVLRLDKMRLLLLGALLIVAFLFILSFMQEKMGNFTINLDRLELFRKGIAIDYDPNFSAPTARLVASPVEDATNISINDIPDNVADVDGDHNGQNYMAYTYYLRNAGKEDVAYVASINVESASKGADDAVRVAVWQNGNKTVYAKASADGTPEKGCVNFVSDSVVCLITEEDFLVGNVDKYTVAVWLEGDDPECVDRIVGGSIQLGMKIASTNEDDTSLLQKYIQDIVDTLTGDKPISAAGNEDPDFQSYDNVTWDTRRNQ